MSLFTYKVATEPWEFEQIHELNYRTFVEEIPQHPPNPERKLVDKFHEQNTYIICLYEQRVIGMITIRDQRPFSLDAKLDNLDQYLPPAKSICELRLFVIDPAHRKGKIMYGLLVKGAQIGLAREYDLAIMSGTTRQLKMYKAFGYVPIGPLVGKPGAMYQPMYITRETLTQRAPWLERLLERAKS
ncbi:MAG: GNAT family N-acetyltransferase [Ardenticatenaceae bacterium]